VKQHDWGFDIKAKTNCSLIPAVIYIVWGAWFSTSSELNLCYLTCHSIAISILNLLVKLAMKMSDMGVDRSKLSLKWTRISIPAVPQKVYGYMANGGGTYTLFIYPVDSINWLEDIICLLGYPKTERYCLSRLCFDMTRHARSRMSWNVVDEHHNNIVGGVRRAQKRPLCQVSDLPWKSHKSRCNHSQIVPSHFSAHHVLWIFKFYYIKKKFIDIKHRR
jgi:hypothetical protein